MLPLKEAIAKAPKLSYNHIAVPEQNGVVVFESAKPAFPCRIGGLEVTNESELKQIFSLACPPTWFSTDDTPKMVEEKRWLKSMNFQDEAIASFLDQYCNIQTYSNAFQDHSHVLLVAPSTSGRNRIPLLFARWLQKTFGGDIYDNIIPLAQEEAKNRRGYVEKVGSPSIVEIPSDAIHLRGRRVILVDDILTSGETINTIQEALAHVGITISGVAVVGAAMSGKPAVTTSAKQLATKLAASLHLDIKQITQQIQVAHSNTYANLLRKAAKDAETNPQAVYDTLTRKAEAIRRTPRLDVSGERPPQSHTDSGGTQKTRNLAGVLPLETGELPPTLPEIGAVYRIMAGSQGSVASSPQRRAITLRDLIPFIDWSPFFHTWELRGRYPTIFDDPNCGSEAKKLFDDAQKLLAEIIDQDGLQLRGACGLFPANRDGEDILVYSDDSRSEVIARFHGLRQQMKKPEGQFNHSIADFVAPAPAKDYIGAFAVTSGHGMTELVKKFKAAHDDYNVIMTEAIADRFAEAFAEYMHKFARDSWGFGKTENLTPEELIREKYRGIRPAPGYPAQPDHTEKWAIWKLLDAERHTGITLTESLAMFPASSVSGLFFAHPESKYFAVGKIERDQVESYAQRKGMSIEDVQKWLQPYLNYDPDSQLTRPCLSGTVA